MSPRTVTNAILRETPLLRTTSTIAEATRTLLDTDLSALPVVDERDEYRGIFGEREFFGALFPAYLKELKYAGFVRRNLEDTLEKRKECGRETVGQHMNTEHVDVGTDYSDIGVAEIFLHHRVLIVPVTDNRRVTGVITRGDFFRSVAERFLEQDTAS